MTRQGLQAFASQMPGSSLRSTCISKDSDAETANCHFTETESLPIILEMLENNPRLCEIDSLEHSSWAERCDYELVNTDLTDVDVESFRKIEHWQDVNKDGRAQMGNIWSSLWPTVLARADKLFERENNNNGADARASNVLFNLLREGTPMDLNYSGLHEDFRNGTNGWLQACNQFTSSAVPQKKALKTLQHALWFIGRFYAAGSVQRLSLTTINGEISWARNIHRFFGLPEAVQAVRSSELGSSSSKRSTSTIYTTIVARGMAWSKMAYYPREHMWPIFFGKHPHYCHYSHLRLEQGMVIPNNTNQLDNNNNNNSQQSTGQQQGDRLASSFGMVVSVLVGVCCLGSSTIDLCIDAEHDDARG